MVEEVITEEERELIDILGKRANLNPFMAENNAIGTLLIASKSGNVDKVIEYCKANPKADLNKIFNFTCKKLTINWDEINDDDEDEK